MLLVLLWLVAGPAVALACLAVPATYYYLLLVAVVAADVVVVHALVVAGGAAAATLHSSACFPAGPP